MAHFSSARKKVSVRNEGKIKTFSDEEDNEYYLVFWKLQSANERNQRRAKQMERHYVHGLGGLV